MRPDSRVDFAHQARGDEMLYPSLIGTNPPFAMQWHIGKMLVARGMWSDDGVPIIRLFRPAVWQCVIGSMLLPASPLHPSIDLDAYGTHGFEIEERFVRAARESGLPNLVFLLNYADGSRVMLVVPVAILMGLSGAREWRKTQ